LSYILLVQTSEGAPTVMTVYYTVRVY